MTPAAFDRLAARLAHQRRSRRDLARAGALLAAAVCGLPLGRAVAQSATPGASPVAGCPATTEAENAAIARRWSEDALTGRDLTVLDQITSPDITWDAGVFPVLHGRKALKDALGQLLVAFPDGQYTVDEVVTQNDLVAVRWTGRGTHQGSFLGIAPTGNPVTFTGINIYRIACGQIVEGWSEADGVAILEQIGTLPPTPAAAIASPAGASPVAAATPVATPVATCASTSLAENEAVVRRFLDAWSAQDVAGFDAVFAANAVHHWGQGADTTGAAAFQQSVSQFFTAFPDITVTLELIFGHGALVVARWTARGTHRGTFFGIAPTGRTVTWTGTNIFRFACGRIIESWSETDGLGLRRQLGALPATVLPASTPAP